MNLDHDTRHCLDDAVALVNTAGMHDPDSLTTPADVLAFADARGMSGPRSGSDAEVRGMRRLRARLRAVFEHAAAGEDTAAIDGVNALLAESGARPHLVTHDGIPWHVHYTPVDAPLDHRFGAEAAMALAAVIREGGLRRLHVCAADDCASVFVDLSRNRSRLYCDTLCGNRMNVAAYRLRQSAGG